MTRQMFLAGLGVLAVALTVLRLALPQLGVSGPIAGRLELVNFGVALAGILIVILVLFRLRQARMSLRWAALVFLWLAACEPAIRVILGGPVAAGGYPGVIANWPELPLMLLALLAFLGLEDDAGRGGRAMLVAEIIAWAATLMRPFLVVGGISRLPLAGDIVSLPGETLTALLRLEQMFNLLKGLFVGPSAIGNLLLATGFVAALVMVGLMGRTSTIPARLRVG